MAHPPLMGEPGMTPGGWGGIEHAGGNGHIGSNSRITSSTASTAPGLTRTLLDRGRGVRP